MKTYEKIALNKDDDKEESQIPVCGYVFPLQYHLLKKFTCVKCMHASLFCAASLRC